MRMISFGSDVLASAGCRRMRDFCGERLPAAVQPFSRQSFDKTQSPVDTRFESTTGDLLSVHRATIFAWRFTRKSSQRLFAQRITRVYSSSPRRRIRPGGSVLCRMDPPGPREGRKAWKAFRGTPRILISHALETRSSKKGPPEPGSPFSSEEPAHQPKRI